MTTTAAKVVAQAGPNFRVGGKQVFLPKHVITFLPPVNDKIPPNFATFRVPLKFNKLDMRDYLYHLYKVEVLSIRSFINEEPVKRMKPGPQGGAVMTKTFRPRSKKLMTVELVKPFVYPSAPKDLSPWQNDQHVALQEEQTAYQDLAKGAQQSGRARISPGQRPVTGPRILLAKHAAALREDTQWSTDAELDETWVEVEKDMKAGEKK